MGCRYTENASADYEQRGRSQRALLLESTVAVALEKGFGNVTIDAVARMAGVSKGGFLYHFPTKRKLIEELLNQFVIKHDGADIPSGSHCLRNVDYRIVAILIAAAESPDFIECMAKAAGVAVEPLPSHRLGQRWQLLAECLKRTTP